MPIKAIDYIDSGTDVKNANDGSEVKKQHNLNNET